MSDELLEYSNKRNNPAAMDSDTAERPAKTGGLNRLSTIFLVVLGLHVVVIVGISAYHLLRGNPDTGMAAMPEPTSAPQVETAKGPEAATAPAAEVTSSMPSPDDKVWQVQGGASAEARAPVAVTSAPMAVPTAERIHLVIKGETIAKIAKANGVTSAALIQANGIKRTMVKIGQKLTIPEAAGTGTGTKSVVKASTPAKAVVAAAAKQESSPAGTYQVAAGDTLAKIAKKFGTKADTIAKLNSINDPKKLKIGMKLQVPGEASAKAPTPVATPAPAGPTDMAMLPKPASN
ncbi:MAG: LysM peptidoglycan-binding domain-containing protein [Verrucomicrobia bacterium]|nr:LysM peptidoglycan-binding domain-containing protein [Verrucomicrobiota bacterium]